MKAIILAGGIGSRLWPLSRELYPKQLLQLTGDVSLLQATVLRAIGAGVEDITIVASHAHRFYVREQVEQLQLSESVSIQIMLEPVGRNTAPAIALAAMQQDEDDVLWVMPADHVLQDKQLAQRLDVAKRLSQQHRLVTFGLTVRSAETGFGYIQQGESLGDGAYDVLAFKEKPNLALAKAYQDSGEYYWNSGMFCFTAGRYLQALQAARGDIFSVCVQTHAGRYQDLGFIKFPEDSFSQCPDESIDYAVMETADTVAVVELEGQWSDVGSWNALYELEDKDENNNVIIGDVLVHETKGTLVHACSRLVATVGVENLSIVETEDALLVADRSEDQKIKQVVAELKKQNREERIAPRKVYRPWGVYEVLAKTNDYELRSVAINPGQMIKEHVHDDRVKQITCLQGCGDVSIDDKIHGLDPGEVLQFGVGQRHCIRNKQSDLLRLFELQMNRLSR